MLALRRCSQPHQWHIKLLAHADVQALPRPVPFLQPTAGFLGVLQSQQGCISSQDLLRKRQRSAWTTSRRNS